MTHDGTAITCAVCGTDAGDVDALAAHLVSAAERSDARHVMWLNRNVTRHRVDASELARLLRRLAAGGSTGQDRVAR